MPRFGGELHIVNGVTTGNEVVRGNDCNGGFCPAGGAVGLLIIIVRDAVPPARQRSRRAVFAGIRSERPCSQARTPAPEIVCSWRQIQRSLHRHGNDGLACERLRAASDTGETFDPSSVSCWAAERMGGERASGLVSKLTIYNCGGGRGVGVGEGEALSTFRLGL